MSRRRRAILIGSPLVAVVLGVGAAAWMQRDVGARAAPGLQRIIACDDRPVPAETRGAWWRASQTLDGSGTLTGWRVAFGVPGRGESELVAPGETSVAGPFRGIVVVAVDDGARSIVDLVSAGSACATPAFETDAVVRRAVLDADRGRLLVHLVDRATRADRGVHVVDARGVAEPLLPPLDQVALRAAGIDRVWTTDLRLSPDGRRLAVQSCSETRCVTRLVASGGGRPPSGGSQPLPDGPIVVLGDPSQGPLVGFAGDVLVAWASCPGLPCDLLAVPLDGSAARVLVEGAVGAGVSRSGRIVATVVEADGDRDVVVDPESGARSPLRGSAASLRPVAVGPGATSGLEAGPDEVAVSGAADRPIPLAVPLEIRP